MKHIVALISCFLLLAVATAAPVRNMPAVRVQPQGDTLHCFVSGDEFFHRLHDAQDYTIVQNTATGQYVYATLSAEGLLAPTTYVPGYDDPKAAGLQPGLMPSRSQLKKMHKAWEVPPQYQPVGGVKTSGANHGTLNNIVIFIRFSDETSCTSASFSTIDEMFNDSSSTSSSMFNYFWRTSYHNLRILTHYRPMPSGSTVLSFQDSHPRSYYAPYSATNTNGYNGDTERRNREFTLLQSAVNWVNTNCPVDTTLNLDMDNDGYVDNICFVVSGTYTDWNDLLWPHKWTLWDRSVYINGKRVWTFNLQLAGSGTHYFGVSTFCHEMTHTLGAPDLYHYYDYTSVSPAGSWDLMNSNATPPQQTNSLFKLKYLNWLDSIPTITDSGTYTLYSLATGPNRACKIPSPSRNQWYILEYRNVADTFDSSIPNRGLLIWRYNNSNDADNADFDFDTTPHELWLFRPGSSIDTVAGNVSGAAFGVNNRTTFGRTSNPHPYLCDGTIDTSFTIRNITISADRHSVSFTFDPHAAVGCGAVTTFPHVQNFEGGDEGCWNFVSASSANSSRTGVISDTAHSGIFSFAFSSYYRATDYNQHLISPRLLHSNPLHLQFYYLRSYTASEKLRVLVSTTGNDISDFTDTLTDLTVTTGGWHLADLLVPTNARYVALNYYSDYLYDLIVDDISLRDTLTVPADTIVRDTTYLYVHDTLYRTIHDTLYRYAHDTLYYTVTDTVEVTVYDTMLYTPEPCQVMVTSNEPFRGKASGSGTYPKGTELQIAALPREGYHFDHWMDGNTDNPRILSVQNDMFISAYFLANNTAKQLVEPTIIYQHDTLVVHDTTWITLRDTVWLTLRDTLRLPNPQHDTLYSEVHQTYALDTTVYYTLTVLSDNEEMGVGAGNGQFPLGCSVEIGALAAEGHHFVQWSDSTTDNPKTLVITGSMQITAFFAEGPSEPIGIDAPTANTTYMVYAHDHRIVVELPEGQDMAIYNLLGQRILYRSGASVRTTIRTQPLRPGVYLVRIGQQPAVKVVNR